MVTASECANETANHHFAGAGAGVKHDRGENYLSKCEAESNKNRYPRDGVWNKTEPGQAALSARPEQTQERINRHKKSAAQFIALANTTTAIALRDSFGVVIEEQH